MKYNIQLIILAHLNWSYTLLAIELTRPSYPRSSISSSSPASSRLLVKQKTSPAFFFNDDDTKKNSNMNMTIYYINECLEIDKKWIENNSGINRPIVSGYLLVPNLLKNGRQRSVKKLYEEYSKHQSIRPRLSSKIDLQSALLSSYFLHMSFYLRLVKKIKPQDLSHLNKTASTDIQEMITGPIECIRQKYKDRIFQISKAFRLALEIENLLFSPLKSHPVEYARDRIS